MKWRDILTREIGDVSRSEIVDLHSLHTTASFNGSNILHNLLRVAELRVSSLESKLSAADRNALRGAPVPPPLSRSSPTSPPLLPPLPPPTPPTSSADTSIANCASGIVATNGAACCAASCGFCDSRASCAARPGGSDRCCVSAIESAGRHCASASDVGCLLADVCAHGLLGDGVCCASSCGACDDAPGCELRAGGYTGCCATGIRQSQQRCHTPHDVACAFTRWADVMARATVAWGVFARDCTEVDAFARACIGCGGARARGVALIDTPSSPTHGAPYASWRCAGATHTFFAEQLLSPTADGNDNSALPASDKRFWPKTQALIRQLLTSVPRAMFYVKCDTDTFINLQRLRSALLLRLPSYASVPPDYLGRARHSLKPARTRELTVQRCSV